MPLFERLRERTPLDASASGPDAFRKIAAGGDYLGRCLTHPAAVHGFFILYALLTVIYYQERLHFDSAKTLVSLVQNDRLIIILGRYANEFPQLLPWVALAGGASLKVIAMFFSLGFCLFHYAIAVLLYHVLGRRDVAFCFILYVLVFLTREFVYPAVGSADGAAFLFLVAAALQSGAKDRRTTLGLFLLALVAAYLAFNAHLLSLPLFAMIVAVIFIRDGRLNAAASAGSLVSLGLCIVDKLGGLGGYDSERMASISVDSLGSSTAGNLVYLLRSHAVLVGLMGFALYAHWRERKKVPGVLVLAAAFLCYYGLVFSYVSAEKYDAFYMWAYLVPAYAPVFLLVFGKSPGDRALLEGWARTAVTLVIVLLAGVGISQGLRFVEVREQYLADVVKSLDPTGRFFTLDRGFSDTHEVRAMDWALAYETTLLTSWRGPADTKVVMTPDRIAQDEYAQWARIGFRKSFFGLPDGVINTQPLNTAKSTAAIFQRGKTDLAVEWRGPETTRTIGGAMRNYITTEDSVQRIPVVITQRGGQRLASRGTEGQIVTVGYSWIKNNERYVTNTRADILAVDVRNEFTQHIDVRTKGIPRDAKLVVDLFLDGRALTRPDVQKLSMIGRESGAWRLDEVQHALTLFKNSPSKWQFEPAPNVPRQEVTLPDGAALKFPGGKFKRHYIIELPPGAMILRSITTGVLPQEIWKAGVWLWLDESVQQPALELQLYREGGRAEGKVITISDLTREPRRWEIEHTFKEAHDSLRILIANRGKQTLRLNLSEAELSMSGVKPIASGSLQ